MAIIQSGEQKINQPPRFNLCVCVRAFFFNLFITSDRVGDLVNAFNRLVAHNQRFTLIKLKWTELGQQRL